MKHTILLSLPLILLFLFGNSTTGTAQEDTLFLRSTPKTIDVGSSRFRQLVCASPIAVGVNQKMVLVYELDSASVADTLSNWIVNNSTGEAVSPLPLPLFTVQRKDHLDLGMAMLQALEERSDSIVSIQIHLADRPTVDGALFFNFAGVGHSPNYSFWNEAARYRLLAIFPAIKDSLDHWTRAIQRTEAMITQTQTTFDDHTTQVEALQEQLNELSPALRDLASRAQVANNHIDSLVKILPTLNKRGHRAMADWTTVREKLKEQYEAMANDEDKGLLKEQLSKVLLLSTYGRQLENLSEQLKQQRASLKPYQLEEQEWHKKMDYINSRS